MTALQRKVPPLTLEEWDQLIGRHLGMIEAGAEICERHAKQLYGVPDWETRALARVEIATRLLREGLLRLEKTRQAMEAKSHVG